MVSREEQLRALPSVDALLSRLSGLLEEFPRRLVVDEIRRVLAGMREEILTGTQVNGKQAEARVEAALRALPCGG
jgi:hypothetical protein